VNIVKYGEKVTVKGIYKRENSDLIVHGRSRSGKKWVLEEGEVEGIFLGIRTLSDGYMDYSEEYAEYCGTEHFRVALISISAKRNPVYAPIPSGVVLRVHPERGAKP